MDELQDLYQQVILDHGRNPRNYRKLETADNHAEGFNPLCGDRITMYVRRDGEKITELAFEGKGCAICTASASMLTQVVKDKTEQQAETMFEQFHTMVTGDSEAEVDTDVMGKLAVFAGVRKYPIRVKCASLPWHTLKACLDNREDPVSTE